MKKYVKYDKNAIDELQNFSLEVKKDLVSIIDILASRGRLEYPEGKKITKDIFEIRLKKRRSV